MSRVNKQMTLDVQFGDNVERNVHDFRSRLVHFQANLRRNSELQLDMRKFSTFRPT